MKKLIATVTTAGLLVLGGTGVAAAADAPSPKAPTATAGHSRARHALRKGLLHVAASTIGIDAKDLVKELRGGKTIAQVAQAHHVDPQKVTDALVTAGNKKIDELAAAGKIDADRAAKLKEKLPSLAERVVNHKAPKGGANGRHRRQAVRRAALKTAADTIGIDAQQLVSEIRSGKTVAEVAQAHNVDPQKVIDALVSAATKRIDDAVAKGDLDASRAAELKSHLVERITKLVNETPHHAPSQSTPSS